MTCPNCGHVYPISNGIPNMVRFLIPTHPWRITLKMSLSSLRNMRSRRENPLRSV